MKSYQQLDEIMNFVAESKTPLTLTDVVNGLGASKTAIYRALNALTELQLLTRLDKKYSMGKKALSWARAFEAENVLISAYDTYLKQLHDEFSLVVNLYELENDQLICIRKYEPDDLFCFQSRVGYPVPLYSTAAGKAILASLSQEARLRYFQKAQKTKLTKITDKTITSQKKLEEQLDEFSQMGYAAEVGENHLEFACVGVALSANGHRDKPMGALSLSSSIYTFTEEKKQACIEALLKIKEADIL